MSNGATDRTDANGDRQPAGFAALSASLRGNSLVALLIGGAAVIAVIAALFLWTSTPPYRVLFNNLDEADGGRIINELDARSVPYRFGAGGRAILVPSDQVHSLRLQLAEQGLPQGGNVGFELMDNQDFGISQFAEQVNYQRSLEGELSRSIESMNPVSLARVHLSMPKPSVFIRDQEPAKASVVLTLHGGRHLAGGQVAAITHLVASSVPELNPQLVTVVNHSGDLLSRNGEELRMDGDQLSHTRQLENRYQAQVEDILSPLFGERNIRVQVAAQVDYAEREETVERYEPNQNGNATLRSTQLSGTLNGAEALARGVPGALSNTPPAWAPSPIAAEDAGAGEEVGNAGDAAQGAEEDSLRYDNVVNYEVDRNIMHIQHQRGNIERLSVAVVINHREGVDEEGNPTRIPLDDNEMEQVRGLVTRSIGLDPVVRGDQLEVANAAFATQFTEEPPAPEWWMRPSVQDMIRELGRYLLLAIAVLFLYRAIMRPLLKRHLAVPTPAPAAAAPSDPEPPAPDRAHTNEEAAPPAQKRRRAQPGLDYQQDLRDARELAEDDPRLVAMVIRSWMNRHGNQ
ncbi:MAG: flagellar basal-body MS-ring/collar protein FliF [Pseudohongiellaceae bacterium]